jgi:uncharacterized protein (DUF2062 family)
MASFVQRRIVEPLLTLLRQGITPQKLALSLACGVVCGIFPVMGSTTILGATAALIFRLNLPAVQLVNYLIYPLQLALIVPFIHAGELILRTDSTHLSLVQMIAIFRANHLQGLHILWRLALHGIFAWLLFAPILFALTYCLFRPPVERMARSIERRRATTAVAL